MASRVSSDDAGGREAFLESIAAEIESAVDTTVDGHPARAIRYWIAARGYPLRVFLDVEYIIDLGGGDALIVTTSENDGGNDNTALLQWIRSTITVP
jgi:hypothetical protein